MAIIFLYRYSRKGQSFKGVRIAVSTRQFTDWKKQRITHPFEDRNVLVFNNKFERFLTKVAFPINSLASIFVVFYPTWFIDDGKGSP